MGFDNLWFEKRCCFQVCPIPEDDAKQSWSIHQASDIAMKTGPWPHLQVRKYRKGEGEIFQAETISDTVMNLLQMSFYMSTTWLLKILYYILVEFKSTTSFQPKQSARLLSRPQVQTTRRKIEGLKLWDFDPSLDLFVIIKAKLLLDSNFHFLENSRI